MPKPSLSVKYSNLVVKFSNKALLLRLKFTVVRAHVAHSVYPVLRWRPFFHPTWLTFSTEISKYAPSKVCLVFVTMQ